jgi:hypothetical protein
MGDTLIDLLPLIVAAGLTPVWVIITLLLLSSEGGLVKALAFAAGATVARLLKGVVFGYLMGPLDSGSEDGSRPVVSFLLLLLGFLMFVVAFRTWRREPDPDAPPPMWMQKASGMSAVAAFGAGAVLVVIAAKQWIFTLSAVGTISQADMSQADGITAFVIYALAAAFPVIVPILISVLLPGRSARVLDFVRTWLERHNRPIVIVVSVIFGAFFLWNGIAGLI